MNAELAALAVHDLKNALGSLEGQLLALESEPTPLAARAARLSCEQLRRETVAFLTIYRDDSLRAVVEDESPLAVLQSLLPREKAATPKVEVVGDEFAPPFWYFDARLVRLALDAALHNARRFARRLVQLSAFERDGSLVLAIDDDGPGLAATANTAGNAPGAWSTGLGTELCRAVARAHRVGERCGRVDLFDRLEGGARFELILP